MLISYKWLQSYVPSIPSVDQITDLITFHICEIESVEKISNGDTVFDLKILPDRAHDLLSHYGVAKEISSLLGLQFKEIEYKTLISKATDLKIDIETKNCRRYMGRIVRGVKIEKSPEWMVKYLESVGQRSINNIVDITNILLFGLGQPVHAFDLKKLDNSHIVVKNAKEGDILELVGSEKLKVTLKSTDMMITDGKNNLAIAGVKGGLLSGISDDTTDILIEVASFDPVSVRKTARRLSVLTDASKRYENDLSSTLCDKAMQEISSLIFEVCPGALFEEIVDIYPSKVDERKVIFTTSYIVKNLGVNITDEAIEKILKNYNYDFSKSDGGMFEVSIPALRLDLTGAHDFIEEIGRAYGYDKVIGELPSIDFERKDSSVWGQISLAKRKLAEDGYREVMTYAFTDKGEVEVLASASDKNFLRNNLTDGLKESIRLNTLNLPLLDMKEIKVFEIGTVFVKDSEEIHVAYGDKKNVVEMSLEKFVKENVPHEFEGRSLKDSSQGPSLGFKMWSSYPFITRDIAVWVPINEDKEKLKNILKELGTDLLIKEPTLFDSFEKDGRTSYAYRLVFQSYDRTLTDEEINPIMQKISEKISSLGWEVR
ncbi:MAG: phenylalanine--tRNA ligase subunit beta [Candidatus Paceibacterota bacterium]